MKYVALLRGVSPLNPNMKNEHLRRVIEGLGYADVRTVISSGNVVFEARHSDVKTLEKQLELAWRQELGFSSTTVVYSQLQLEELAQQELFGITDDKPRTRQQVTFVQTLPPSLPEVPYESDRGDYRVTKLYGRAVCFIIDSTAEKTPNYTAWVEGHFGKAITTRSWRTVLRILHKMQEE